jgi:DNA-binding PadR family transcriptional regulator
MLEIGADSIDTASGFVNYVSEEYGFSKSSIWYNLNRLKEQSLVEFASKDEIGKPLTLTKAGRGALAGFENARSELLTYFSNAMMQKVGAFGRACAGRAFG